MTIPADEAASALRDAEAAAGRSAAAHGYRVASGHLFVWGAVWAIANVAAQVSARAGEIGWALMVIVGVVGSTLVSRGRKGAGDATSGLSKALLIAAAIAGFGVCLQAIAPPLSSAQTDAVACLMVGAVYVATGAAAGLRLSAIGAALMAATLIGWLYLRDWFFLWVAFTGGGGLIAGGLWFRKV